MEKKQGFTLMETLITVAIIGVLAAIAIPVFRTQLGNVRTATCAANRRSLHAVLTVEYMTEGTLAGTSASAGQVMTIPLTDGMKAKYVCPDGKGNLSATFDGHAVTVVCAKHHQSVSNLLQQGLDAILEQKPDGASRIDSNAGAGSNFTAIVEKTVGDALSAVNVQTWAIVRDRGDKKNYLFIWSTYATRDDGNRPYASVPAMCYNKKTQTYTVGLTSVSTNGTYGGESTYDFIAPGAQNNGFHPAGGQTFATLSEATVFFATLSPTAKK